MDQETEYTEPQVIPGSVLVAGCGFIVTAAGWALFGFLEEEFTGASSALVFFSFAIAHGLIGIAILKRRPAAFLVGALIAITGLFVALIKPQFVLVFTNCVILALSLLARGNVARHSSSD
jgi:hypothetical protein